MKRILFIITSFYSLLLAAVLLYVAAETMASIGFVLVLLPVAVYFFLRVTHFLPGFKKVFSKKRYLITMRISGVIAAVIMSIVLFANIISIRQIIHILFTVVFLPVVLHFGVIAHDFYQSRFGVKKKSRSHAKETVSEEKNQTSDGEYVIEEAPENSIIAETLAAVSEMGFSDGQASAAVETVSAASDADIKEQKRRTFLKLLASAGAGVFLTSLMNPSKASAAFFGSVPGPGVLAIKDTTGTKIDPAIKSPTDGYGISNVDSNSYPAYYGFVNKDGAWYILQENPQNTFTYVSGPSNFSASWTGRAGLTYGTYDSIF